jgi:hypothetical protein
MSLSKQYLKTHTKGNKMLRSNGIQNIQLYCICYKYLILKFIVSLMTHSLKEKTEENLEI